MWEIWRIQWRVEDPQDVGDVSWADRCIIGLGGLCLYIRKASVSSEETGSNGKGNKILQSKISCSTLKDAHASP